MHWFFKIFCAHTQIVQEKISSTMFDKQFGERWYYCLLRQFKCSSFCKNYISLRLICIGFSNFFAPMHKLSKKKFLLLCLASNLVRGDITASLIKTIWYLVFKYRKSSICKTFITPKLWDGKIAVLGLGLPWCASCTPSQSFWVVNVNKYTITLTQTKYHIVFLKELSNIPWKNCAVKH